MPTEVREFVASHGMAACLFSSPLFLESGVSYAALQRLLLDPPPSDMHQASQLADFLYLIMPRLLPTH